jgi:hypothetical protein
MEDAGCGVVSVTQILRAISCCKDALWSIFSPQITRHSTSYPAASTTHTVVAFVRQIQNQKGHNSCVCTRHQRANGGEPIIDSHLFSSSSDHEARGDGRAIFGNYDKYSTAISSERSFQSTVPFRATPLYTTQKIILKDLWRRRRQN